MTNYDKWDDDEQLEAWMRVGMAQRDVPAHIAHEYCRPDRSSHHFLPSFNEENLPRTLTFYNQTGTSDQSWFPHYSLGWDFAFIRSNEGQFPAQVRATGRWSLPNPRIANLDLVAVRHLDEVRIADLTQSREKLSRPASYTGLGY